MPITDWTWGSGSTRTTYVNTTDTTNASGWTNITFDYDNPGHRQKGDQEPEGPLDWLDQRVEEMCAKGRKAMQPAA